MLFNKNKYVIVVKLLWYKGSKTLRGWSWNSGFHFNRFIPSFYCLNERSVTQNPLVVHLMFSPRSVLLVKSHLHARSENKEILLLNKRKRVK